jgi:hypothetical protein
MGDESYGYPVGIAVAWLDGQKRPTGDYWPFAHLHGGNLPREAVLGWVTDLAKDPDVHLVTANGSYELGWLLATLGIKPANPIHDVQLAAPLLALSCGTSEELAALGLFAAPRLLLQK